jgi:choline-sulfatase
VSNALLLISDEHNPRFSSIYGHPFIQTPGMDWLALNGTVYENAYCPSPLCMPCRSAFMTGRRVHEIQTYNNCRLNVEPSHRTYGRVLSEQGVHCVHIGKTHVFAPGADLGFSEVFRSGDDASSGDMYIRRKPLQVRTNAAERAGRYGVAPEHLALDTGHIDAAISWITETAGTVDRPWIRTAT